MIEYLKHAYIGGASAARKKATVQVFHLGSFQGCGKNYIPRYTPGACNVGHGPWTFGLNLPMDGDAICRGDLKSVPLLQFRVQVFIQVRYIYSSSVHMCRS